MNHLTIKFSCQACGLTDVAVMVEARQTNQTIMHWMENCVLGKITFKHHLLSPVCFSKELQDLKIPLPKAGTHIGAATDNIPPDGPPGAQP